MYYKCVAGVYVNATKRSKFADVGFPCTFTEMDLMVSYNLCEKMLLLFDRQNCVAELYSTLLFRYYNSEGTFGITNFKAMGLHATILFVLLQNIHPFVIVGNTTMRFDFSNL
jgi:hypothetical protein